MMPVSLLLLSLFFMAAWRAEASQADPAPSENETGCGLGFGEQVTWEGRSDNYVACNMTTASSFELGICRADGNGHNNFTYCFAEPETKCHGSLWFINCSDLGSCRYCVNMFTGLPDDCYLNPRYGACTNQAGSSYCTVAGSTSTQSVTSCPLSASGDELDSGLIIAISGVAGFLAILACVAALACRKKPEEEQKVEVMIDWAVEEGNVTPPPAVTEEREEASLSSAPPVEPPVEEPAPAEMEYTWKGDEHAGKGSDDIEVHWQNVTMYAVEPPPMDAE